MTRYNCVPNREPDGTEFSRVANLIALNPANRTDIDDTIHSWPAEATGGINIQPYQDMSSTQQARSTRWDVYTTLIHEMMHVLEHPNYKRTYRVIPSGEEILKEGMADVMRRDLWDGPGQLRARLVRPASAPTRERIEGAPYALDESVIQYHGDYPLITEARRIVNGDGTFPGVGMNNAKAAFFMGHTDLLGLGAGTQTTQGASLAGIANYAPRDSADADIVVAQVGDTFDTIQARTNAPPDGIIDTRTGRPIRPTDSIARGTRLRVPGIRYVYTIEEDTLQSIAVQNGIDPVQLATINGLPSDTPRDHRFPNGTRLLIPFRGRL